MAGIFCKRLFAARREAGFKSAYAFYHGNGGRRHFPFTYVHYLRIERGASLPRPDWMAKLSAALRLSPSRAAGRRLFLSYLEDLMGTREAFETVVEPLLSSAEGSADFGASLPPVVKAEHSAHLSPKQFKAIASGEAAYWCYELLANDSGSWTAANAAQALGLASEAAKAGLDRLCAVGLARKTRSGLYKSRRPGTYHTFPGRVAGLEDELKRIEGYWSAMSRRRGSPVAARVEVVRAESSFIRRYAATLNETIEAAASGNLYARGENTGLYLVESRIRKLAPF